MVKGAVSRPHESCHTPPPGLAFGEPDDRLQRGIQYAEASRLIISVSGILDHPPSRVMTTVVNLRLAAPSGWTISRNGGLRSLIRVRELAVGASGPILSILQPCFGQTSMECGQNVADLA